MATMKIGAECCNNCIHWECRGREIEGSPPSEVKVYSDHNKCSVSGSMIAYLLGITQMDSKRFNLSFFRFMTLPE